MINRLFCCVTLLIALMNTPLWAQPWQLLVLSETPQTADAFEPLLLRRIEQSLMEQLSNAGQTVYDRRLAGLPGCGANGCFGLDDVALVSLARRSNKAIDAVLLYNVEVSEISSAAVVRWRIRIPLYMIELETGKRISSWQGFSREFDNLPAGCIASCFEQWLAEQAALVAADAGYAITERLNNYPRTYSYSLTLQGFAIGEYAAIEQWLLAPAEFDQARLSLQQTQHNRRQILHAIADKTYALSTQRGAGSTEALLRQVFDQHGMSVSVQLQPGTRQFLLMREGLPYSNRYLLGVVAVILAGVLALYCRFVFNHRARLANLARAGRFNELQQQLSTLQQQHWPMWPAWRGWQRRAADLQQQVQQLQQPVVEAIKQQQFDQVSSKLQALATQITDNPLLQKLQQKLSNAETARQLISLAQREQQQEPAKAVRHYTEALQLNPALQEDIQPQLQPLQQQVRNGLVSNALAKAEKHLAVGEAIAAISMLDHVLLQIQQLAEFVTERQKLSALRQQAVAKIKPVGDLVHMQNDGLQLTLYLADSLQIARKADPNLPSLAIDYQRLSRAGKQNLLSFKDGGFWLQDQGSSNGSWLNNIELPPHKAMPIAQTALLAMGGERSPSRPGICQLKLTQAKTTTGALLIQLQTENLTLFAQSDISQSWSSLLQDKSRMFCLLAQNLTIGVVNNQLDVGCISGSQPLAILRRNNDNQLVIEPVISAGSSRVQLNGIALYGETPLPNAAKLGISGVNVTLQQEG